MASDFIDELTSHYKMTQMATKIAKSFDHYHENARRYLANYMVEKDSRSVALKLDTRGVQKAATTWESPWLQHKSLRA